MDSEESDDEEEDEEEEDQEEDDSDNELEASKKYASQLQSQLDIQKNQTETLARQLQQVIEKVNNQPEVDDTVDIFSGREDDDYPTIKELKEFQKRVVAKQLKVPARTAQPVDTESAWVTDQPDFDSVEKYVTRNMATLNLDPTVQAAGGSILSKYLAVKSIMKEDQLNQLRKKEKQQKKMKQKKKNRGRVPNTETSAKRKANATPVGKKDPVDAFFNQKWNTRK